MTLKHWTRDRHGNVVFFPPRRPPPRTTPMMTYPFPLHRGGVIARLILPVDLTMHEATRLGRMVRTLAIDATPESIDQLNREMAG